MDPPEKTRKLTKTEKVIEKVTLALYSQQEAKEWRKKYYKAIKGRDCCVNCGEEMCHGCIKECSQCEMKYCSACVKYCKGKCYSSICKVCGPYCAKCTPKPELEKAK